MCKHKIINLDSGNNEAVGVDRGAERKGIEGEVRYNHTFNVDFFRRKKLEKHATFLLLFYELRAKIKAWDSGDTG